MDFSTPKFPGFGNFGVAGGVEYLFSGGQLSDLELLPATGFVKKSLPMSARSHTHAAI
jgi:hypothetical protein